MFKRKILPAIFVVLPAAAALTAQTATVEATADACRTRPGSATQPGAHWYYRVNRIDNHRPDQRGHMLTGFAEPAGNRLAAEARRDASVWRALTPTERTRDLQRPVCLASRLHHSRGRLEPVELMAS
jgi:hypothetical protein